MVEIMHEVWVVGKVFHDPWRSVDLKKPSNKPDQPLDSTQKQALTLRHPTSHQQSTFNGKLNARHFPNHHKAPVHSVAMSRGALGQMFLLFQQKGGKNLQVLSKAVSFF